MSTFKRTARMRVGGRGYGGPNGIGLPTPTPPSPPPQEWVDRTESEEEDPEELVPELSEDEPEEEPREEPLEVQPPAPPSAPPQSNPGRSRRSTVDPEDPEQDPDAGDAPPSDDDEDDDEAGPEVTTTHRRFDYPPPVPRMPRETPEMLHYDRPDRLCGDSLPPSRPTR
ncbi:hypothetical protein U9M48_027595 [Paspalum notatum var. saurae]|uniref:Uncharacterized protein n=1 Tax=Paspalum notatum var. saurae TaxID=547442 RepID=A0AAQ3TVH6_PASNO